MIYYFIIIIGFCQIYIIFIFINIIFFANCAIITLIFIISSYSFGKTLLLLTLPSPKHKPQT